MKKYLQPKRFLLDVEINIEYVYEEIAASNLISHPENMSRKKRIRDVKLQILNDVAMSVLNSIKSKKNLKLISHHQTDSTYSYYIDFNVFSDEGNLLLPVRIRFRVSDHKMKGGETPLSSSKIVIRSFVLNGETFDNSVAIISAIDDICEELDKGNIFVLDSYEL